MAAVMISLVSEQAIPNVMAPLLVEEQPERVLCLAPMDLRIAGRPTHDPDFLRVFKGIKDVLVEMRKEVQLVEEPVHPYEIERIMEICRKVRRKQPSGDKVIFNVTGGTKLMALGAYRVAREQSPPDLIVYVDSETRRLVLIQGELTASPPFDESRLAQITPECYLQSYGIEAEFDNPGLYSPTMYEASRFILAEPRAYDAVKKLRAYLETGRSTSGRSVIPRDNLTEEEMEILKQFRQYGLFRELSENNHAITITTEKHQFDYLTERWLSFYVYVVLQDMQESTGSPFFTHRRLHGDLDWYGRARTGARDNEIDVCAVRGAQILLVECKGGEWEIAPKNINKLRLIGEKCGRYAQKLLVTMDRRPMETENKNFREVIRHALLADIGIVGREEIQRLPEIVRDVAGYIKTLRNILGM